MGVWCVGAAELGSERPGETVEGSFGCAVVGASGEGHDGQARADHDNGGGSRRNGRQVWEEVGDHVQRGEVVGGQLGVDGGQGDGLGAREVERTLETGIEDDRVELWVRFGDSGRKTGSVLEWDGKAWKWGTKDLFAQSPMASRSETSNASPATLSAPCFATNASSLSFLRPTAMTKMPLAIMRSASAWPMPDVAPVTSTVLYGNGMVVDELGCLGIEGTRRDGRTKCKEMEATYLSHLVETSVQVHDATCTVRGAGGRGGEATSSIGTEQAGNAATYRNGHIGGIKARGEEGYLIYEIKKLPNSEHWEGVAQFAGVERRESLQ